MTKETNDNLLLWNQVEKTIDRKNTTKHVDQRGGFTAIDATHQAKRATEIFGPYGKSWGLKDINMEYRELTTGAGGLQQIAILTAIFYTPDSEVATGNSIEIQSAGGRFDGDFMKKLITNTLSKELARLGFNADIFMGKFEDDKYIAELDEESHADRVRKEVAEITDTDKLREYFAKNGNYGEKVSKIITDRAEELKTVNVD